METEAHLNISPLSQGQNPALLSLFIFSRFKLFTFRERGREGDRERETSVCELHWLVASPQMETWPATQACALTRNQTGDHSMCQPGLNPLSYTSRGSSVSLLKNSGVYGGGETP